MIKRADWLAIGKDRTAIFLLFVMFVLLVVIGVTTVLRVQGSDIQLPVRFTAYGQNNIYRDQWYMHYSYLAFGLVIVLLNGFLAIKTYQMNRTLSLGFLGLSIFIMLLATIIMYAIFNLALL